MDRRLFLTGLLGVAGTAALATAVPRRAGAAAGNPLDELRPPRPGDMPEWEVAEKPIEEGEQYAVSNGSGNRPVWQRRRERYGHGHGHHRRRRRRRYRRWRRNCYWRYGRRICRRVPYFIWGWY